VTLAGAAGSVALADQAAAAQDRTVAAQLGRRAVATQAAVALAVDRQVARIGELAAALSSHDELTAVDFDTMTAPLARDPMFGASAVSYVVPATDRTVADIRRYWRGRGQPQLTLKPVGAGPHYFAVLSRSLDGMPTRIGTDLAQAPEPTAALVEAARTGRTAVSDSYILLRDRDLPADRQQLAFTLAAPVYNPTAADGSQRLRGWVVLGLRGRDFLVGTLAKAAQEATAVTLSSVESDGAAVPVVSIGDQPPPGAVERELGIPVAQRQWRLRMSMMDSGLAAWGWYSVERVTLVAGVGGSTLIGLVVLLLAGGRARTLGSRVPSDPPTPDALTPGAVTPNPPTIVRQPKPGDWPDSTTATMVITEATGSPPEFSGSGGHGGARGFGHPPGS
jgi:hypothetical protein